MEVGASVGAATLCCGCAEVVAAMAVVAAAAVPVSMHHRCSESVWSTVMPEGKCDLPVPI